MLKPGGGESHMKQMGDARHLTEGFKFKFRGLN